ncbi:hypothetical protein BV25DRAFT_1910301 [Artomyces pyxidatus]|uniref:Uncharacterized protein n=1 Tax=Artomyces pyxidatus TaxID=48021 RepID=A0ACB8TJA4_9AGAM|nr:hypothetical protein BV25DRAFT_1910301 [Artomyces pyxidatus]
MSHGIVKTVSTPDPVQPTPAEILIWTTTESAIAPCFAKDVFLMTESSDKSYYLLGRVPCRTVRLVGTVVGATSYESRTVYLLDDGTGIIDCNLRHPKPNRSSAAVNVRPALEHHKQFEKEYDTAETLPPTVFAVGVTVRVIGKVYAKKFGREILCDSIERCHSSSAELEHWRHVIKLHKESYTSTEPFVLPEVVAIAAQSSPPKPTTPKSKPHTMAPATPSTAYTTPSTSSASSPAKSVSDASSPPRLRHPSRLHTRDLTQNTFRIYVKHYMDHTTASPSTQHDDTDCDSDADSIVFALNRVPDSPTKRSRTSFEEQTPRPLRLLTIDHSSTPRASENPHAKTFCEDAKDSPERPLGFTLSYLRRVPELSMLAQRVVRAEGRRREKEAKKAHAGFIDTAKGKDGRANLPRSQSEGVARKMKRLFMWAIRKLYEEGSIIISDGPVRPLPYRAAEASMLWRASSSNTAGNITSNTISSTSSSFTRHLDDSLDSVGELSDPVPGEESYIPVTVEYLAEQVEGAIKILTSPPAPPIAMNVSEGSRGIVSSVPAVSRRRVFCANGPTKEEITACLRRDARWDRLGTWAVQDALDWMQQEGKVWRAIEEDGGRWELCV